MKAVYILTIGAVLLVPLAAAAAGDTRAEPGMTIFVQQKCTLCHSIAGSGNKKGPLDDVGSRLTQAEIREWIVDPAGMTAKAKATRKPPMKKTAMAPADVDALVTLLSSLKKR